MLDSLFSGDPDFARISKRSFPLLELFPMLEVGARILGWQACGNGPWERRFYGIEVDAWNGGTGCPAQLMSA